MINSGVIGMMLFKHPPVVIHNQTTAETFSTYHTNSDGTATITYISGGSGYISILWGLSTYYLSPGSPTVTIPSLYGGPTVYNYTITDYGYTPTTSWGDSVTVNYVTPNTDFYSTHSFG